MSQPSVDGEQAVGDALDVVHAARRRRGAAAPSRRRSPASATSGRSRSRSVSFVADTIGTSTPNASSARRTRLVVEERDDRLAERHRLDREDPVPAGVQLVDDDVSAAVALARLVVA